MYKDIYKFMLKYPSNVEHFSKEQIVFTDRSLLRKDFIVLSGEMIEVFLMKEMKENLQHFYIELVMFLVLWVRIPILFLKLQE